MSLRLSDLPSHVLAITGKARAKRKYNNEPTLLDGLRFDSRAEAKRYGELRLMERAGAITDLQRQVPFELVPACKRPGGGTERPVVYLADFVYHEGPTGQRVVEDVKGAMTPEYRLKRKLMLWRWGVEIREIRA